MDPLERAVDRAAHQSEIDRLRAKYDEMGVLLADKHNVISALRTELTTKVAEIEAYKEVEKQRTEFFLEIETLRKRVAELEARERNHIEVANRRLARAEQAEKRVAELEARLKQYDRPVAIHDPRPEPPHNASGWPGEDQ